MVIGVTGPSGAGKSLFCSFLAESGCLVLDCDKIYHSLVNSPSPCTRALAEEEMFGERVLREDGSLDRAVMASIVFAPGGKEKQKRLNEITHAFVLDEVRRSIGNAGDGIPAIIIDAPLLFQAGFEAECDFTVALIASPKLRLSRLRIRDEKTDEELSARLAAAPHDSFYTTRADFTIINDGDTEALRLAARNLLTEVGR